MIYFCLTKDEEENIEKLNDLAEITQAGSRIQISGVPALIKVSSYWMSQHSKVRQMHLPTHVLKELLSTDSCFFF